ncbi:PREDICTED: protein POLLENLESS 3-LIKE 2-like [Ipomoea nil]|uniref:protein POLLENLESS 3-LIKE 2-like n=1 Tax=Ipomoea nil TaxID=35883 RepID=UPI000901908A|nr:PREDICTED: protein POLLENLESS 3-LIKE 2-like [Ipomoea nil]
MVSPTASPNGRIIRPLHYTLPFHRAEPPSRPRKDETFRHFLYPQQRFVKMLQDMVNNAPPGFRPSKSAPASPAKPLAGGLSRMRSDSFHITHKVPVGDTPYVIAKNVQLVDKDPERAIPLFWAAINAGDRVDSALKDMAIVMKQQNRAEEAIEAIRSLRHRCSDQAQEALDNILLDLFKRCGRLDDQIALLKHKLFLIQQGLAFNGKRTKTARSQGKKFQVSVEQEANRLLGNLGWALMQQNKYNEAEEAYRRALVVAPDNNKMCNLGICLMKQGRIGEAKENLRRVRPAVADGPRGMDSHLKAYERAQQMLRDLESEMMIKAGTDRLQQSKVFESFLGSSAIWQPQPCTEHHHHNINTSFPMPTIHDVDQFPDENLNSCNIIMNNNQRRNVGKALTFCTVMNPLNSHAPPFYSAQQPFVGAAQLPERLKRTRSGNGVIINSFTEENNKVMRKQEEKEEDKVVSAEGLLLPDSKEFEDAIIAAVLGSDDTESLKPEAIRKVDKRLKVFQDITLSSLSPKGGV